MNIPIPVTNKEVYALVPGYMIETNLEKEQSNCKQKYVVVYGNRKSMEEIQKEKRNKLGLSCAKLSSSLG